MFRIDLSHANLGLLAICVCIISLTTAGLGLMFGMPEPDNERRFVIPMPPTTCCWFFCGINVPVSRLPEWAQLIASCLPLTRGVQAAREVVQVRAWPGVGTLAGRACGWMIYALVGYALFAWLEHQARAVGCRKLTDPRFRVG